MTRHPFTAKERRLHVAVIAAAAVVAALMVVAALWSVTRPSPPRALPASSLTHTGDSSATSAATTTVVASVPPAPSTAASTTPPPTSTTTKTPVSTHTSVIVSAHKIAYRKAGALYVAKEDGSGARPVYGDSSEYALSPDGVRVASVENGKLAVVAVGTRPESASDLTPGTDCVDIAPVWTPDSSAVLFIRTGSDTEPAVWRYNLATNDLTKLGPGSGVAISPNGRTIVALPTETSDSLRVWRADGSSYKVKAPGDPRVVALNNGRIFVSTASNSTASASLWSLSLDGKQRKKIAAGASAGDAAASYEHVWPSPDGKRVLYTVDGDDGYSRMRVVPVTGGASTAISGRRDGYPLGWTADSNHILFIEGNAIQLETTALWRCDYLGHNRTRLVKGATI